LQSARAFVFGAPEDFGILLAEAQACGTPVLAYGRGGAREIVRDLGSPEPTGVLFPEQSPESLNDAVQRFESSTSITAESCRSNALRFSTRVFRARMRQILDAAWERWSSGNWPLHEEQLFPLLQSFPTEERIFQTRLE
jgi:glycosyltransferase involved in cell wall biosynthesis